MAKAGGKSENIKAIANRFVKASVTFSPALVREFAAPELAVQMAGTKDKKSKEYKTALRTVQRYKQGTRGAKKPAKTTVEKIQRAARELVKKQPKVADAVIGPGSVTISGQFFYSEDSRFRTIRVNYFADEMGEFLGIAQKDEREEAQEHFVTKYGEGADIGLRLADESSARIVFESED
jgi:hypothetical protein